MHGPDALRRVGDDPPQDRRRRRRARCARASRSSSALCLRGAPFNVHWTLTECEAPNLGDVGGQGPGRLLRAHRLPALSRTATAARTSSTRTSSRHRAAPRQAASRVLVGGMPKREADQSLQALKTLLERARLSAASAPSTSSRTISRRRHARRGRARRTGRRTGCTRGRGPRAAPRSARARRRGSTAGPRRERSISGVRSGAVGRPAGPVVRRQHALGVRDLDGVDRPASTIAASTRRRRHLLEARKRVPTSAPWAPSASAAASPRPSAIPPAAATGIAPARSTTSGTSTIVPTQPPWPPASPPWATTTSAPAASAASAWPRSTTCWIQRMPSAWARATSSSSTPMWNEIAAGASAASPRRRPRRTGGSCG